MNSLPSDRPELEGLFGSPPPFSIWENPHQWDLIPPHEFDPSPTGPVGSGNSFQTIQGRAEDALHAAITSQMIRLNERIERLEAQNMKLWEALTQMHANMSMGYAWLDKSKEEVMSSRVRSDMEIDSESEGEHKADDEVTKKTALSTAYADSNGFKSLIRQIYIEALGCPGKLTADHLPEFPKGETAWPMKFGTAIPLMRFHWDRPHTDPHNWENILLISKEIQVNGAQISPRAAAAIKHVSKEDREARVIRKFRDLCKSLRITKPAVTMGTVAVEGGEVAGPVANRELSKSSRQSRAKGKLEVRMRKRDHLPLTDDLRHPRYDAAMTVTLMSDDENSFNEAGTLIAAQFISRAPIYRTIVLEEFYNKIDEAPDPQPSKKYTRRVRGPPKDVPPPSSTILKNKARRWMVKAEWLALEGNKQFDLPSRIANSGRLWGDAQDPEETEAKQKRVREETGEIKRKKPKLDDITEKETLAEETLAEETLMEEWSSRRKGKSRAIEEDQANPELVGGDTTVSEPGPSGLYAFFNPARPLSDVVTHTKRAANYGSLICNRCGVGSLSSQSSLYRHQKYHCLGFHRAERYKCQYCDQSMSRLDALNRHKKKCHPEDTMSMTITLPPLYPFQSAIDQVVHPVDAGHLQVSPNTPFSGGVPGCLTEGVPDLPRSYPGAGTNYHQLDIHPPYVALPVGVDPTLELIQPTSDGFRVISDGDHLPPAGQSSMHPEAISEYPINVHDDQPVTYPADGQQPEPSI